MWVMDDAVNIFLKKKKSFLFMTATSSLLLRLFSSCSEWGLLSSCDESVSCCRAETVGQLGSVVVLPRL